MAFPKRAPFRPAPRRPRVVLVEDDAQLREILGIAFKDRYELLSLGRGDLAVPNIERFQPALVILDIHVPGMNGFEICERLKAHSTLRRIPVMFLTSRVDRWSQDAARRVDADYYVPKPFEMNALLSKIEEALRGPGA